MCSATMRASDRVRKGLQIESQIANSLRKSGLVLEDSTNRQDILQKVDRWIVKDGVKTPIQIKYRESGEDILFEVFDTFVGWNNPKNKIGRDMEGIAAKYAVLIKGNITVIPTQTAKELIQEMLMEARQNGWSKKSMNGATLYFRHNGYEMQLKLQSDPFDGRQKIVAYIPADYFQSQRMAQTYKLAV